jgi:2-succinyl-5-enolpyruvyl-6-hydroxy-3-cyclohexene-1-carboxylate synthase
MPDEGNLFTASSLPVRHLDQFARPTHKSIRALSNRGASGIDGTIASAVGAGSESNAPLVLVTGDIAFYHDLNSLFALKRFGSNVTIVLINNNGGGIFHRLPVSGYEPPFVHLFLTPHGLTFEPVVRMFGIDYHHVSGRNEFRDTFSLAVKSNQSQVIEVVTDSEHHESVRRRLFAAIHNGDNFGHVNYSNRGIEDNK